MAKPISYTAELQRKAIHLFALVVPFGLWWQGRSFMLSIMLPITLIAIFGDYVRVRHEGMRGFIRTYFGFVMREEEWPALGGAIVFNGATWVCVFSTLLILFFPAHIAIAAFIIFMLGDAAAALVGRRWGKIRIGNNPKSVEGTLAFILIGLLVVWALPETLFLSGLLGTIAAALAEASPKPFNDNIQSPLSGAIVMFLIERFYFDMPISLYFIG